MTWPSRSQISRASPPERVPGLHPWAEIGLRRRWGPAAWRCPNSALHLVAVTQVRMRSSSGRRFFDRNFTEGKTRNEAMRCLKRRIAAHVWRRMLADQRRRHTRHAEPAPATSHNTEAPRVRWLVDTSVQEPGALHDRLLIWGESAGARISARTLLRVRDRYRAADRFWRRTSCSGCTTSAWRRACGAGGDRNLFLSTPIIEWFADYLLPGIPSHERQQPDISPVHADLTGLPPALFKPRRWNTGAKTLPGSGSRWPSASPRWPGPAGSSRPRRGPAAHPAEAQPVKRGLRTTRRSTRPRARTARRWRGGTDDRGDRDGATHTELQRV